MPRELIAAYYAKIEFFRSLLGTTAHRKRVDCGRTAAKNQITVKYEDYA
jgi:hypothetical protein